MTDLINIQLPKWPQMLVTGKRITQEQADEIIFRTDIFLTDAYEHAGGNNRQFNVQYRNDAGLDRFQEPKQITEGHKFMSTNWEKQSKLWQLLGVIRTNYVKNDWASCSFIGGPHGWCHPDGTISFSDNVGKWPSVREIYDEWSEIAHTFQFLDLHDTLMSGESCEDTEPLVNLRVVNGEVTLEQPDDSMHEVANNTVNSFLNKLSDPWDASNELGLPGDWYRKFAQLVRNAVEEIEDEK